MLTEWRDTSETAARHAGQIVREMLNGPLNVRLKSPRNLVTDADQAAQDAILSLIDERHPGDFVLAEESPTLAPDEHGVWGIPPGVVWLIDPLDGTTNYAHGLPVFCVSVGVALDGEPVAGAIYDPLRDELFSGARGLGAALNGAALPSLHPLPLDQALLGLDWSSDPRVRARSLAAAATILSVCHTGRALGSAALGHVYVAARRVHLYYHFHLQPWDVAAAAAILREVGGEIRRPEGGAWRLGEPALLSGHPALLDRLPPL